MDHQNLGYFVDFDFRTDLNYYSYKLKILLQQIILKINLFSLNQNPIKTISLFPIAKIHQSFFVTFTQNPLSQIFKTIQNQIKKHYKLQTQIITPKKSPLPMIQRRTWKPNPNSDQNIDIQRANTQTQHSQQQDLRISIDFTYINPTKLYTHDGKYNLTYLRSSLLDDGVLKRQDLLELMDKFANIIRYEQNMIKINGNVTIIGDIHGQYYDFMKAMNLISTNYLEILNTFNNGYLLFLGDYVDRGIHSVQVITFVMALKVNNPKNVFCLRGNHQSRVMTIIYNFKTEVIIKYDQEVYQKFMQIFDLMPIVCKVNNHFFCVHGGISDKLTDIKKINNLDRYQEIPTKGPFCDLIWSDPFPIEKKPTTKQVEFNKNRLCSIFFGQVLTTRFLENNHLWTIVRAHEVFPQGYQKRDWNKKHPHIPSIITIFSAPNYCGIYGNKAAILNIKADNNLQIRQFKSQQIQNNLQADIQIFEWTIPQILRVINSFAENMAQQFCEVYLYKDFEHLKQLTPYQKVQMFMEYINKYRNKPAWDHALRKSSLKQENKNHKEFLCINKSHSINEKQPNKVFDYDEKKEKSSKKLK